MIRHSVDQSDFWGGWWGQLEELGCEEEIVVVLLHVGTFLWLESGTWGHLKSPWSLHSLVDPFLLGPKMQWQFERWKVTRKVGQLSVSHSSHSFGIYSRVLDVAPLPRSPQVRHLVVPRDYALNVLLQVVEEPIPPCSRDEVARWRLL